jgi:hypothetical protein
VKFNVYLGVQFFTKDSNFSKEELADLRDFIKTEMIDKLIDYTPFNMDSGSSPVYDGISAFYIHTHPNSIVNVSQRNAAKDLTKKFMFPMNSFSGKKYVKLPRMVIESGAVINIKNVDTKCFLWCLAAHEYKKYIKKKKKKIRKDEVDYNTASFGEYFVKDSSPLFYISIDKIKEYLGKIRIKKYPVELKDIKEIEEENNIKVMVYGLFETTCEEIINYELVKMYGENENKEEVINLLLYKEHYCYITNIKKLLKCFNSKKRSLLCEKCGTKIFSSYKSLKEHEKECFKAKRSQKWRLPEKECNKLSFDDYSKLLRVPFRIYADFESYFEKKVSICDTKNIKYLKEHKMMAWGYKVVGEVGNWGLESKSLIDLGKTETLEESFVLSLMGTLSKIENILKNDLPMSDLTDEEAAAHTNAKQCMFCGNALSGDKVKDHNHLTGKYRGASHRVCNLLYSKKCNFVPIFFHNLSGYDLHLVIGALGKFGSNFSIIPKSKEKYLALNVSFKDIGIKLRFVDSLHFISGSLAGWAQKLSTSDFRFIDGAKSKLRFKQFFPYCYFTQTDSKKINDILRETVIPTASIDWFDELNNEFVKEKDIEWAANTFKEFNCKNLSNYTKLYLEIDVLLLAEVFEKFIETSVSRYCLDPCWFYTVPGYAWSCAFYMTKKSVDLLNTPELVEFFLHNAIRGGISTVCRKKRLVANNEYMGNLYDPSKPKNYILYLDVTNLYGHSMSQPLPEGEFVFLGKEEISFYFENIELLFDFNSEYGYILEVDLDYPAELFDQHVDLPFAPEHYKEKLSPNFYNKKNYKLHYRNLELYLRFGLKLVKIHKLLKFKQSQWLKEFIDFNTEIRKKSSNVLEKDQAKLMNNSVFGKTMENIIGRPNYKLFGKNDIKKVLKHLSKSEYKSEHIISSDLVLLEFEKKTILFDKPIYIGFSILELSKWWLYTLIYDVIKPNFSNSCISYIDTDVAFSVGGISSIMTCSDSTV